MKNPSYVALSRLTGLSRNLEIVANNLANMGSTGFKGERLLFETELARVQANPGTGSIAFVRSPATVRNLDEGALLKTDNPLDLAIKGRGYFSLQTPDGVRYTRNGRFEFNEQGQIVNSAGFPLLAEDGQPIQVALEDQDIAVASDGTLSNAAGTIARIGVSTFANEFQLKKVAGGLYETEAEATPAGAETALVQGSIENSNVEPLFEINNLIALQRNYESTKRLLDAEDERQKRVIRTILKSA